MTLRPDTKSAFKWLLQSLGDLCTAFNDQRFFPLLEADIATYLYHRML